MFLVNWHHETSEDLEGVYWKTYRKLLVPSEIFDWFCHLALNPTNYFSLQLINLMRSYSCLPQCLELSRVSMQLIFSDFETGCNRRTSHGRRTQSDWALTLCNVGTQSQPMSEAKCVHTICLSYSSWRSTIWSGWNGKNQYGVLTEIIMRWYVLRGCHIPD